MRETAQKIYSVFRQSWGGRFFFVGHVLFALLIDRYYGSDIGLVSLPRLVFTLINLPQFTVLIPLTIWLPRSVFSLAVVTLFLSIPWWAYGCAAEHFVRTRQSSSKG